MKQRIRIQNANHSEYSQRLLDTLRTRAGVCIGDEFIAEIDESGEAEFDAGFRRCAAYVGETCVIVK